MSFKSKRIIVSMIIGVIIAIIYICFAVNKNMPGAEDAATLKSWAVLMLIFIAIGIVATIIMQIIFHIVFSIGIAIKENGNLDEDVERIIESSVMEDEMDKTINLKAEYLGFVIVGIGFVGSLITLVLGMSAVFSLNFIFASFAVSSLVSGIISIVAFERGL